MIYLVEVTYYDDSKQKGIAELIREQCTAQCGIFPEGEVHRDWDIPRDSHLRAGMAKKVVPIRELKAETQATDKLPIDYFLGAGVL